MTASKENKFKLGHYQANGLRSSRNGRRENANELREDFVQLQNCPTQVEAFARRLSRAPKSRASRGTSGQKPGLNGPPVRNRRTSPQRTAQSIIARTDGAYSWDKTRPL
jgi:hypothetical protein